MRIASTPRGTGTDKRLPVGPAGYVTGIDIALDGKQVCRTDVGGAYRREADGKWTQIVTDSSLPALPSGVRDQFSNAAFHDGPGVYEIVQAPSNSSYLYMLYKGILLSSTTRGDLWVEKTAFARTKLLANTDVQRQWNQKIAVHPSSPNTLLIGTQEGARWSTDGGNTVSTVTGPIAGALSGGDPTPNLVATNGTIWVVTQHGTGIWICTSGGPGGTYTLNTAGPTTFSDVRFDHLGDLWVCAGAGSGTNGLWRYSGGAWTQYTVPGLNDGPFSMAVDPTDGNKLVVMSNGGTTAASLERGETWIGNSYWNGTFPAPRGIIKRNTIHPWLNDTTTFISRLAWSPAGADRLKCGEGLGVMECTPPTTRVTWYWDERSEGIEELGFTGVFTAPGNPRKFLQGIDKPIFRLTDLSRYPTKAEFVHPQPLDVNKRVDHNWDMQGALDDADRIYSVINFNTQSLCTSPDGGDTWELMTQPPATILGGALAVGNTGNVILIPGNNSKGYFTLDGTTWNDLVIGGETLVNFTNSMWTRRYAVTADTTAPGTFYILINSSNQGSNNANFRGVWKTTDGGVSWSRVYTATIHSPSVDFWSGRMRCVPGKTGRLFYTPGIGSGWTNAPFYRSDAGATDWTPVANVTEVASFGFGKAMTSSIHPTLFIYGKVNGALGCYMSVDDAVTWIKLGRTYPGDWIFGVNAVDGDWNEFGRCYLNMGGGGLFYVDFKHQLSLS